MWVLRNGRARIRCLFIRVFVRKTFTNRNYIQIRYNVYPIPNLEFEFGHDYEGSLSAVVPSPDESSIVIPSHLEDAEVSTQNLLIQAMCYKSMQFLREQDYDQSMYNPKVHLTEELMVRALLDAEQHSNPMKQRKDVI